MLYEMQVWRWRCIETVANCSKCLDRRQWMQVAQNQYVFVGRWLRDCLCGSDVRKATRSVVYDGHRWAMTWCMNTADLNWIWNLTGNKWSSWRDEAMCDRRSSSRTRRAAAFCTRWSGAVVDAGSRCDSVRGTSLAAPWFLGWLCLGAVATCGGGRSKWKQSCWYDAVSSVHCRARPWHCARRHHCQSLSHRSVESTGWMGSLQGWHRN